MLIPSSTYHYRFGRVNTCILVGKGGKGDRHNSVPSVPSICNCHKSDDFLHCKLLQIIDKLSVMQCPRDYSKLVLRQKEEVVGSVCGACKGVFLTPEGVRSFKFNHESDVLENIFKLNLKTNANIQCPGCHSYMALVNVDGVEIDACKNCQGIWFDHTEVTNIIKKYGKKYGIRKNDNGIFWLALSEFLIE